MKRTTGNGTPAIQTLYLMWNVPFIHVCKIGISGSVSKRRKEISETTAGYVFPVWFVVMPWAYQVERLLHWVFAWFRVRVNGSGGTEWFIALVMPFAWALMNVAFLAAWSFVVGLVLVFVWLVSGCPQEPVESLGRLISKMMQ